MRISSEEIGRDDGELVSRRMVGEPREPATRGAGDERDEGAGGRVGEIGRLGEPGQRHPAQPVDAAVPLADEGVDSRLRHARPCG